MDCQDKNDKFKEKHLELAISALNIAFVHFTNAGYELKTSIKLKKIVDER